MFGRITSLSSVRHCQPQHKVSFLSTVPSIQSIQPSRLASGASPRSASSSIWNSIIPRALRSPTNHWSKSRASVKRTGWNPATFFIIAFLIVGSNAIQMIALRNAHQNFNRKTEARIGLLREAIERVQQGQVVDVKRLLGTGNAVEEEEWIEVMQELQRAEASTSDGRSADSRKPGSYSSEQSEQTSHPTEPAERFQGGNFPQESKGRFF